MPSESKLPPREIGICRRLVEIRELLNLKQKELGAALGVSSDRIASYENFRAPIRYDLGDKICSVFDLNQRWLATGQHPQLQYFKVPAALSESIRSRALFTEAYDEVLKNWIDTSWESASGVVHHPDGRLVQVEELDLHLVSNNEWKIRRSGGQPGIDPAALLRPLLTTQITKVFETLPKELRSRFYRHVGRAVFDFLRKHGVKD